MQSEIFVANSDALNRNRMVFTVGALEDGVFENALGGIPALLSHDITFKAAKASPLESLKYE